MKIRLPSYLRPLVVSIILLSANISCYATHIFGVDLFYDQTGTNTYQISLVVYGDCSGVPVFYDLPTSTPTVYIYNGSSLYTTVTLAIQPPIYGIEVTPVCPADSDLTTCHSLSYTIPGIKKFVYTYTITLPSESVDWRFLFEGNMGGSSAGRSNMITNILSPGTSIIELVDTLNNTLTTNSSPALTTIPTPFYCVNSSDNYNPGAVDPELDSLMFFLVPGIDASTGSSVNYIYPYTATAPLATASGSFSFNNYTGQLSFIPNILQRALVVYNVEKWRHDTLAGTCQREMTFLVLNCTSTPPTGAFTSATNGTIVDSTDFKICAGVGPFTIDITPKEVDTTNLITVISSGLPAGATFTVYNNTTTSPTCEFSWNSDSVTAGTYTFYVTYKDNNCPSIGVQTLAYNVTILPTPTAAITQLISATCTHSAVYSITPGGFGSPWTVATTMGTDTIAMDTGVTATVIDTLPPDNYAIQITSAATLCRYDSAVSIPEPLPVAPLDSFTQPSYCGSCNGTITLYNLNAGETDTLKYSVNGVWQPPLVTTIPADSVVSFTSLCAGVYDSFTIIYGHCISPPIGPVTLVDPALNMSYVSFTSPTACGFCNGSLILHGLHPFQLDTINYTINGIPQTPVTAYIGIDSIVVLTDLCGGVYDSFVAHTAGVCISNMLGPDTLSTDPPVPVIFSISNNGPICAGDTLKLSCTATPGVTYSWTGPGSFASSLQNPVFPCAASDSGIYTLSVVSDSGCPSIPLSTNAIVYQLPATPVAGSNSPVCSDSTLFLSATDATADVGYSWTGPDSFASGIQYPSISGVPMAGNGVYSVTATTTVGCVSPPGIVYVVVDSTPTITIVTYTNPTTCLGSDGSITLGGMIPGNVYLLNYEKGAVGFSEIILADSSGEFVFMGLSSATYSGIVATSEGCPSNIAGPVTLHDPAIPVITSISNSGPVCNGAGIKFSCTSTEAIATYSWTGPSFTSTLQNPSITVTTLSDSGFYSVTASDSGCTSLPASTEVIIHPVPSTPVAVSNSPICADSTLIFSASDITPGVTYTWSGPLSYTWTGASPVLSDAKLDNAGTYYVVASTPYCVSPPDSTTVIINPTPVIAIFSYTNPTTCSGSDGTITLSGATAGITYLVTYKFIESPVSETLIASDSGRITFTGLSSGEYTDFQITEGSCPSNIVGPVILHDPAPPAIPAITDNSPICVNNTLLFNSNDTASGISFSWTGPGFAFADTASNPFIDSAGTDVAGVYTLTVEKNNCFSSNTVNAVVNVPPPIPSVHSNSPVCAGSTLTMYASSSAGCVYSWSGPSGFGSATTDTTVTIGSVGLGATGTYIVLATLGKCPSSVDTIQVLVNPLPPAPAVVDTSYCQYAPAVALVATGSNLLWYTSSSGGSGTPSAPMPSTLTAGESTWYVSQTVAACEGPRATQTVLIIPQPAPPVVAPQTLCQLSGGTVMPKATGDSLFWYLSGAASGSWSTPTVPLDAVQVFTWTVTQTINGCTSNPATDTVTVKETPATPTAIIPSVCSGDTLKFNASDTSRGISYLWNGVGGFTSTIASPVIIDASPSQSGPYMVMVTLNGCSSGVDTVMATVYNRPEFSIIASKPYVCQNDTITLAYSGPTSGVVTYRWYYPWDNSYVYGIGPEVLSFNSPGSEEVYLMVSTANCSNTEEINILVMPQPAGVIYIKPDVCVGETADVSILNIQGKVLNYNWEYAPAELSSPSANPWDPQHLVWSAPGTYTVTLTVTTDMQCPSAVISDTVNVHPLPVATIAEPSASLPAICENDTLLFRPTAYVPGSQYRWSPAPFFNNNDAESTYGTIAFTGYITLNVTNQWGCAASDSVLVNTESCCQLAMPNAFMPDKIGSVNAIYRPITIRTFNVHIFRIVNRWGQTVFETNNLANGWDGTFNGVPQDVGVYFYYLKYDCEGKTIEKTGDVTLIR